MAERLEIVRCEASDDVRWNAFVDACPRASFYHRAEWRAINRDSFGHDTVHLAALDQGRIVGIFPIVQVKSLLFGNLACSMPFVNYGGPCGLDDDIEARLLEAGRTVADEWGVDYLEIRSTRHLGAAYPTSEHKVSMTVALDPDPEVVMARFKREHRGEIRRAAKRGYVMRIGHELVEDFYDVLSAGWRELGTPVFQPQYLKRILKAFPQRTRVYVVYAADGTPAAGAFVGIHNGTIEGMWLGLTAEYRQRLVGYVLYWELIRDACLLGCHTYHLGRSSKDSGGETFKTKWNAHAVQLYWTYVLRTRSEMPGLRPDNPKYRLAIDAWRHLPLSVTQVLGPVIAGSIP